MKSRLLFWKSNTGLECVPLIFFIEEDGIMRMSSTDGEYMRGRGFKNPEVVSHPAAFDNIFNRQFVTDNHRIGEHHYHSETRLFIDD